MSSENPVADRLVSDARKKEAQPASSPLNIAALTCSLIGLAGAGWIPLIAALALVGIALGVVSSRKPGNIKIAWLAVGVGAVAVVVAIVFTIVQPFSGS